MVKSSTPIRQMLMRMIVLSTAAVLAVTTTAFCGYEFVTFRQASVQQLQILSQAIASNSTAALAFENREDAVAVLTAFRADPHIVAAALYDTEGRIFASYRPGTGARDFPQRPGDLGYRFGRSALTGFQPVAEGARRLGTLRAVSERHDYSVRAARTGAQEFDLFTDTFNHMLGEIQGSERKLQEQLGRLSLLQHITRATGERQDLPSIFQVVLGSSEEDLPIVELTS